MRRTRSITAILAVTALAVTACGGGSSSSGTTAATTAGTSAASTAAGSTAAGSPASSAGSAGGTSAAAGTASSAVDPGPGGPFTIALANDPGNLDPSMTALSVTRFVSHLAYDTLIAYGDDGTPVGSLAKSWDVTPTVVTFTLNTGITCSDGSPFTAKDAAANITYVGDPANKSPLLGVYVDPGTKAVGDNAKNTVTVTPPAPNAFTLNNLSNVFMICAAGLADHSQLAKKTLGTGPWVLSEVAPDDHYSYTKRDGYAWGPGGQTVTEPGSPDTVNVRIIANETTAANLLLAGQVNLATVSGKDATRLDAAQLKTVNVAAPTGETWFNQGDGHPGSDPAVRQALFLGTNLEQIQKVATGGKGGPSKGMVTVDPKACDTDTVSGNLPAFDPDKAKQVLDQAGWAVGADGIRSKDGKPLAMTFVYLPSAAAGLTAAAELLTAQWKDLGVALTLKTITSTQLNEIFFGTGAWDAGWASITVNLPSQLVPFVSGPVPPNGTNFSHIDNSTYTSNAKQASTQGIEKACPLWAAAETSLFTSFDMLPMFDVYASTYFKNGSATISGGEIWGSSLRLTTG